MSLITMDPDRLREYSLKEDTGENKTVFLLGALNRFVFAHIGRQATIPGEKRKVVNKEGKEVEYDAQDVTLLLSLIVMHGVRGWRGLLNEDGSDVAFQTEEVEIPIIGAQKVMKSNLLGRFNFQQISELAQEVQRISVLVEPDRKN